MCLATPVKLKDIRNNKGIIDSQQGEKEIDLSLIPRAKSGDWLLCHGELAINTLVEEEAKKILELVSACPHNH